MLLLKKNMVNENLDLYNESIKKNPLKTKDDLINALTTIINPLVPFLKQQKPGRLHLGTSGSVYNETAREGEAFLRPLWGIGPLSTLKRKEDTTLIKYFVDGLKEATNPESESYYGKLHDYDQMMVEMASISLSLVLSKDIFWDPLTDKEQDNLYNFLQQINDHNIPDTNWLFFRILVNVAMKKCGRKYDKERLQSDLEKIDSFYLNDGWYFDGYKNQIDYYIPFGMHYYGLLYAKIMEKDDPVNSAKFKERARIFAKDFVNWFSADGPSFAFGRSQTYRFAQSAFWCALAFADVEALPWGVIKGIVMRNLRYWFNQDIFSADGLLTIGYGYQNLNMAEGYNAPGSPYWALKDFVLLAVPKDHPFWTSTEEELPFERKSVQKSPRMIVCHDKTGKEVQAFTSGQHCHEHAHAESKYEKFVYSTTFGFSVSKGKFSLVQGAFDSTLALAERDGFYKTRYGVESYDIKENYIESVWKPWDDVTVKTFIIPSSPYHVRIHVLDTNRTLNTAEGGFCGPSFIGTKVDSKSGAYYKFNNCITGITDLMHDRESKLIEPEPNTNYLYPRTMLPILTGKIEKGRHILACAVLGGVELSNDFDLSKKPILTIHGDYATVKFIDKEITLKIL